MSDLRPQRTASDNQIAAARLAWPVELSPPSDDELRSIIEAVLAVPYPDGYSDE
jgi:hypothetical protein